MSDNQIIQTENNKTNIISKKCFFLWPCQQKIAEAVKNYGHESWYKSYRGVSMLLILFQALLVLFVGMQIEMLHFSVIFSSATYLVPLLYLGGRGYRPFLALFGVTYGLERLFTYFNGFNTISAISFLIALFTLSFLLSAYRVSELRAKEHTTSFKIILKDVVIAFLIMLTFFISGYVYWRFNRG